MIKVRPQLENTEQALDEGAAKVSLVLGQDLHNRVILILKHKKKHGIYITSRYVSLQGSILCLNYSEVNIFDTDCALYIQRTPLDNVQKALLHNATLHSSP